MKVLRDSKPWVVIAPVDASGVPGIDRPTDGVVPVDESAGHAILPAEWSDREDEGLYDDLV